MKKWVLTVLVALITGAGVAGCGEKAGLPEVDRSEVRVTISLDPLVLNNRGRTVGEIEKVRLTVTGTGMNPATFDLAWDPVNKIASGTFWIQVGLRTFKAEALGGGDEVLYAGEKTASVEVGKVAVVSILLKPPTGAVQVTGIVHPFDGPPTIEFTFVPEYGSYEDLQGKVKNVNPRGYAVAVYIKVGSSWWTKPYWNSPKTPIGTDGAWTCDITTGGIDQTATVIRAYLIRADYDPPLAPSMGLPPDPPNDNVLAMVEVTRTPAP